MLLSRYIASIITQQFDETINFKCTMTSLAGARVEQNTRAAESIYQNWRNFLELHYA